MSVKLQTLTESTQENSLKRLRKIEGQIRGIQRMIEEERYCAEILSRQQ